MAEADIPKWLKMYSVEETIEHLREHLISPHPGRSFNTFIEGGTIHMPEISITYPTSILFGRDVFGKVSQCYKITENLLSIKRMPREISPEVVNNRNNRVWNEVPSGVIVVIRATKDGEIVKESIKDEAKTDGTYHFNDFKKCTWDIYFFSKNIEWDDFLKRVKKFVPEANVKTHHINITDKRIQNRALNLLLVSERIDPKEEDSERKFDEEFVSTFGQILTARYQLPKDTKQYFFLFSGGVDSLFVVAMAARTFPKGSEFVLFNVAFGKNAFDKDSEKTEQANDVKDNGKAPREFEEGSDRIGGLYAYNWLVKQYPEMKFTFVRVNVPKDELQAERRSKIAYAITPNYTVLDDSLGCAFWFATRGKGIVVDDDGVEHDVSYDDAKYFLVGSGSDELLAGYHKFFTEQFKTAAAQKAELERLLRDIGNRNFGRDDRVALSNKRTLLIPFMDEAFVQFVNAFPLSQKIIYGRPPGEGVKIVLRNALKLLGAPERLYTKTKKAFQFGSHIAKLEEKYENADDICYRLLLLDVNDVPNGGAAGDAQANGAENPLPNRPRSKGVPKHNIM